MNNAQSKNIFYPFLDFYWKFIALSFVTLVIWTIMNISLEKGESYEITSDPIFLLLLFFIIFSAIAGGFNFYKGKTIYITDNEIEFRSRWLTRSYKLDNIEYIRASKRRLFHFNELLPVIKIKVKNRNNHIKINPNSYKKDKELTEKLAFLSKELDK